MRISLRSRGMRAAYAVIGVLVGAAGAFVSLKAPLVGVLLAAAAGVLFVGQASGQRWFAVGGFLLGMGACAAVFLSPALTNRDPSVTYDPSTVPFFLVCAALGLCGAVTLAVATGATLRRRSA